MGAGFADGTTSPSPATRLTVVAVITSEHVGEERVTQGHAADLLGLQIGIEHLKCSADGKTPGRRSRNRRARSPKPRRCWTWLAMPRFLPASQRDQLAESRLLCPGGHQPGSSPRSATPKVAEDRRRLDCNVRGLFARGRFAPTTSIELAVPEELLSEAAIGPPGALSPKRLSDVNRLLLPVVPRRCGCGG